MADRSIVEVAQALAANKPPTALRGLCYVAQTPPEETIILPTFQETAKDHQAFIAMFHSFYANNDPVSARPLAQQQDSRFLIHNPPQPPLSTSELDAVHALPFTRDCHPLHLQEGPVKALETIRFALAPHRGCDGECNFCAIAVHQGRTIQSRSIDSLVREAASFTADPAFKGIITDAGGPTANMYGFDCARKHVKGACQDKRCLYPRICPSVKPQHRAQLELLRRLKAIPGIRKINVASGIRYDLILADKQHGAEYLRTVIRHHTSGQMKVAPEHSDAAVLEAMGKPGMESLLRFREQFNRMTAEEGLAQFLTYYMIAGHPACTLESMEALRRFCRRELKLLPRQVQLFTPSPSTWSTLMYHTGINPFTGSPCFCEKNPAARERQKAVLTGTMAPKASPPVQQPPKTNKPRRRKH